MAEQCECRVTLAELGDALGVSTEQAGIWVQDLDCEVAPDWCSRSALAVPDARRVMEAYARRRAELAEATARREAEAYQRATTGREAWIRQQEAKLSVGAQPQVVRRFDSHGHLVSES